MWILRILYYLGMIKLVWLEDYNDKIYLTYRKKSPFGDYWAWVHPMTFKEEKVNLNSDGTCSGSYIKRWCDYQSIGDKNMIKLEDVEKAIVNKTIFEVEIINVETNISDTGHFLDCSMRFLDGPLKDEVVPVRWVKV